ncbi:MAG: DUF2605 domain-containing protein [Symploca sp. SIO2B6]|nr:DUF2605 domain-containing protein [Symploca sp. SIO2B6]
MNDQAELLQQVLKPLLDDFMYWFDRAQTLLSSHEMPTLTTEEQADLLACVSQARSEVATAQSLFELVEGQVGVDMSVVNQWHQLVAQCWTVSIAYHRSKGNAAS